MKTASSITDHDIEELVTHIWHYIDVNEKINEHDINGVINNKMIIEGNELFKNSPFVYFISEESKIKWKFVCL